MAARALFPRGLAQPAHAFRFGLDALLLAAFAGRFAKDGPCRKRALSLPALGQTTVAELGSGCGAALLGLLLENPHLQGVGFEREADLVEASVRNAALLGLQERCQFHCMDLALVSHQLPGLLGKCQMVLANPPYSSTHSGRPSASPLREQALRSSTALPLFCKAASLLLPHHGHFFCIFDASQLSRLTLALNQAGFGLVRLMPVRPDARQPASRILVHARKACRSGLELMPALSLYASAKARAARNLSRKALAFCPWLGIHGGSA